MTSDFSLRGGGMFPVPPLRNRRRRWPNAANPSEAILFLEEVAGRRGFPARSFIRKGDPMPGGGEWHWTKDGQYYWKADTSSDEIVVTFSFSASRMIVA